MIPEDWKTWGVNAANPAALSRTLAAQQREAYLFRDLATLREDIPLFDDVEALRWEGPRPEFEAIAEAMESRKVEKSKSGDVTQK